MDARALNNWNRSNCCCDHDAGLLAFSGSLARNGTAMAPVLLNNVGNMLRSAHTIIRITRALIALGIGTLTGATLAVLVVEGRFSALADLIWRVGWILQGRRMAAGEADDGWLLEIEMRIALGSALLIALVGSAVWAAVPWRNRKSYRSAALIGFVLAAVMAGIWLHGEDTSQAIMHVALIGLSGAIAGCITLTIALSRTCSPPRNG